MRPCLAGCVEKGGVQPGDFLTETPSITGDRTPPGLCFRGHLQHRVASLPTLTLAEKSLLLRFISASCVTVACLLSLSEPQLLRRMRVLTNEGTGRRPSGRTHNKVLDAEEMLRNP